MKSEELSSLVTQAVQEGVAPAVQIQVFVGHESSHSLYAGSLSANRPVNSETVFDVASVTKVISTTACVYHLVSRDLLGFDDRVCEYLPGFESNGKEQTTVRELLGHRSGLPAWAPLFDLVVNDPLGKRLYPEFRTQSSPPAESYRRAREMVLSAVCQSPLLHPPGTRIYSDFGFIALGAMIEQITGESLHDFAAKTVFGPLGMHSSSFRPLSGSAPHAHIAPTGSTRPREPAPGQEHLYQVHSQETKIRAGTVDDDNAYALGGVAGHAGVFSTARDVAWFGIQMIEELRGARRLGEPAILLEMIQADQPTCLPGRGLGFDHPSGPKSSTGERLRNSGPLPVFGHLGFTGCSIWVDPNRDLSVSILSNRVFPTRKNQSGIKAFRPSFHNALIRTLTGDS